MEKDKENRIREIIQEEMRKNYYSGSPQVPPHIHDGVSNSRISSTNILYPNSVNGTIDMAHQTIYTLGLTGKGPIPKQVTIYGGALNSSLGVHSMIVGLSLILFCCCCCFVV